MEAKVEEITKALPSKIGPRNYGPVTHKTDNATAGFSHTPDPIKDRFDATEHQYCGNE